MKKNLQYAVALMLLSSCLSGCFFIPEGFGSFATDGYRPVYGSETQMEIELISSRSIKNPGKIYTYKNFLLVNEVGQGIHVFDNRDPETPKAIGFIQMLGNSDMAIKDDILYADHMGNLVAITVNDFNTLDQKGSLMLQNWDQGLPPPSGSYFECIDQSKGIVIQWTKVELKNPSCYAIN